MAHMFMVWFSCVVYRGGDVAAGLTLRRLPLPHTIMFYCFIAGILKRSFGTNCLTLHKIIDSVCDTVAVMTLLVSSNSILKMQSCDNNHDSHCTVSYRDK